MKSIYEEFFRDSLRKEIYRLEELEVHMLFSL